MRQDLHGPLLRAAQHQAAGAGEPGPQRQEEPGRRLVQEDGRRGDRRGPEAHEGRPLGARVKTFDLDLIA